MAVAFVSSIFGSILVPGNLGRSLTMTVGNDNDLVAIAGNVDRTGWSNQGKGTDSSKIKDNLYNSI